MVASAGTLVAREGGGGDARAMIGGLVGGRENKIIITTNVN